MGRASSPAEWFGEAAFEHEGEQYTLTFNNMALLEAEGALGISMMDWLPQLYAAIKTGRNPLMKHLAALVFGGLKVNHPDITQVATVGMVVARDPGLRDAIKKALASIEMPEDLAEQAGNEPSPPVNRKTRRAANSKAGAGTRSTKGGAKRATTRKRSGAKP